MEPFLAVGDLLAKAGHEVVCVMPAQFRDLVAEAGLGFAPLDRRFLELIEGASGKAIMGQKGSGLRRIGQLAQLARESLGIQRKIVVEQRNYVVQHQPDRILYHPKCIFGRAWGMANPGKATGISPIPNWLHPVREYPHIAFSTNFGRRGNLFSYRLVNFFTALMSANYNKPFAADFPALKINYSSIARYMREQERMLYLVSTTLFPRPAYWPAQARVMGYFERPKTRTWSPPVELLAFLERYRSQPITFITFGSMVNADPEKTTDSILAALKEKQVPAILNTASGGLVVRPDAPDHVFFIDKLPYEWIFPQVHSVVHHGGSGTTHTALKHGCASLIIPHIIDQFFWNKRVADLGAGPLGVKVKHLRKDNFGALLTELRQNSRYRQRAEALGAAMTAEANVAELLQALAE